MVNEDNYAVMWEQEDNYKGLQQVRGLGGNPPRVTPSGLSRFTMTPGAYGEYEPIDEIAMTVRRQYGSFSTPVKLDDLVMRIQKKLLVRRLDRIENIIWTLFTSGTFAVAGPSGAILHTDVYTPQTFTATTTWGTPATSTPLQDLRSIQLLSRGHGLDFGSRAKLYMNRATFNGMLNNTNSADLGGRRGAGLASINGPEALNQLLAMDDLPTIVIYDQGYLADPSGTFTLHIPNNKAVIVGRRTDASPVGEYKMVRNINNPEFAPGPYTRVIDRGETVIPRLIEVHDGHSGGPALMFPSAIVTLTV